MIVNKMTVDGNEYFLDPEQSIDDAKSSVIDAVQHGGGLVDIQVIGRAKVSVLVSQSIPVVFEIIDADENTDEGSENDLGDWDYLLS
jgi:hypothetical protein